MTLSLHLLYSGLTGLLILLSSPGAHSAQEIVTNDTYFYGQSPPVYPSPNSSGRGNWENAYTRARKLAAQLTLEEKVSLTAGITPENGCSGFLPAIERIGFPGMCLNDGGNGVRGVDYVSSFPSGLHVGASWNKKLAHQRGRALGSEYRRKGVNVALGPVVGPLGRVVKGGRNWEGFSVDPYLSGVLVGETITGVQSEGVMTSTKHYIGNEQETHRQPSGNVSSVSSNIDDRTMHELYLWPFQDAVKAGTSSIMCSYQRVNNSYGCANSKTLNGLLKTELGFQGFVLSDWDAQLAGVATALAGLDMAMPTSELWGNNLTEAIRNGSIPEARLTDMVTRILAPWYRLSQDQHFTEPGFGMPKDVTKSHGVVDARDPAASPVIRQGAVEGHVLVKNTKNTLPLKSPRMLSLYGYSAKGADQYGPSSGALENYAWSLGLQAVNATEVLLGIAGYGDFSLPPIAINGTMFSGGGSGSTTPATSLAPFDALREKAYEDGTALFYDFLTENPGVDPTSDACIVMGNAWATEGFDRLAIHDAYTDSLIRNVADQCERTIVVFHNAGPRLVDQFVDHPNVTAIIFAHLPGQDSGPALVSLLYGKENFSGKLPYSITKKASDYGTVLSPAQPKGIFELFPQADFNEAVYLDYRYFDKNNISLRYEFGFGLSYTTFQLSELSVQLSKGKNFSTFQNGEVMDGGQRDLWDTVATVQATIQNTGELAGAEVVQLYVGIPNAPVKQLRGFEKPVLEPGKSTRVKFSLTRRDLSVWNTTAQKWEIQKGTYTIEVGTSSKHLTLIDKIIF